MKKSPDMTRFEEILRSSPIAAGGFLGSDSRNLNDILDADLTQLNRAGITAPQLATEMQQITLAATARLGAWIDIDNKGRARVEEYRGAIVCPWPHDFRCAKRITTLELTQPAECLRWSDLNIHLIAEHGFFGGRGSLFRIEPAELVRALL